MSKSKKFRDLLPRVLYAIAGIGIVVLSFMHPISAHILFFVISAAIWFETISLLFAQDLRLKLILFLLGVVPLLLILLDFIYIVQVTSSEMYAIISIIFVLQWLFSARYKENSLIALLVFVILNVSLFNWFYVMGDSWEPLRWIYWLVLVWINDTFAYFSGRLFGKHKIAPEISPGKTLEGVIGGGFFTILTASLIAYLSSDSIFDNHVNYLISAIIVSVVGPAGDLFESAIKRHVGVKDSGKLLGPHGGIYDRMDAWLFVAACVNITLP